MLRRWHRWGNSAGLALPIAGWFFWFLLIPLAIIFVYSFATKGTYGGIVYRFSVENYLRATDPIYLQVLWNSIKLAVFTTVSCLILGFPMAYVMATASPRMRSVLLMAVVIPFWTNFVVRAYAIKLLLGETGPVNAVLLSLKIVPEPLALGNSDLAIWLGMVTNYLPFMVLPLFVALEKFDFTLLEAAKDLGARPLDLLLRILLPMTRAGIVTGSLFVFTPALGEFVIPDLLGGARTMLIGNLMSEQFLKARDWPFGSALSLILVLTVMVSLVVYLKYSGEVEKVDGSEQKPQKEGSWR
jgi:spermidine/putrescine transport system permease protein